MGFVCRSHDPVRSEFEPTGRTVKRQRSKPDSTDESTVSSTTSDEESTPKPLTSQKSTRETPEKALVTQESVSSTPLKDTVVLPEIKANERRASTFLEPNQNGSDSSDDDTPLSNRVRRMSKSRHIQKKIRACAKRLEPDTS